jgi:predicted kinase
VARVDVPTDPDAPEVPEGRRGAGELVRRLAALDDKHPSSPRYAAERGRPTAAPDHDAQGGQDVREADRAEFVRAALADARKAGLSTDQQYTTDDLRKSWTLERLALQQEIVNDLYNESSHVPCEGKAVLAGGLPGSGKTTVLTTVAGIDLSKYLVINPDNIKEVMASRGMVPAVEGLTPMEASDLVHVESSLIAKRLAIRAYAEGKNVIWDITMKSLESTQQRIVDLRVAGYRDIEGVFVDIPLDVSVRRADARHREGHEAFLEGKGCGGRYVPPEVITGQADRDYGSINRGVFEQVKHEFNLWRLYDNSVDGRAAVLVAEGSGAHDEHRRRPDDQ